MPLHSPLGEEEPPDYLSVGQPKRGQLGNLLGPTESFSGVPTAQFWPCKPIRLGSGTMKPTGRRPTRGRSNGHKVERINRTRSLAKWILHARGSGSL
jgi:hypothetical protein